MMPDAETTVAEAFRYSVSCLQRFGASYVTVGARVLSVWGQPRDTDDVDFLVLLGARDFGYLIARLVEAGMWNTRYREGYTRLIFRGIPIDFLRPRDPHDSQLFRRRVRRYLEGAEYWIVGPEDFVLQKLKAGRPRDLQDARSVIARCGAGLDRTYLRGWARALTIEERLEDVFRPARNGARNGNGHGPRSATLRP
jgi:hypothetical protein